MRIVTSGQMLDFFVKNVLERSRSPRMIEDHVFNEKLVVLKSY